MRASALLFAAPAAAAPSLISRQSGQQQPLQQPLLNVTDALWDGQCYYPKATPVFNLDNYLGRWYQVAGSAFSETAGCTCIYAEYSSNANGTVNVLNGCQAAGREVKINGIANPANAAYGDTGVFRVRFPPAPADQDCAGPNYIVQMYTPDWAIVQSSNFSTLFLLSREQHPGGDKIDAWLDIAGELGTNMTDVSKVDQTGCMFV